MSGCNVCVYQGFDGETTGYRRVFVKAGRPWECCECGRQIPKGALFELASGFHADDGNSHWNAKTCVLCAEIAEAFCCNGRYHGADFWQDFPFEKLDTSCFDKLDTPEAHKDDVEMATGALRKRILRHQLENDGKALRLKRLGIWFSEVQP